MPNKALLTIVIRLTLLSRSPQWSSNNEGPQNISDFVNNSEASEDCMKESEESDLDEDEVLEVCSCSCDEKVRNDVVQILYNLYDREVIAFFNMITYLGGKAMTCFIRGPLNLGDGN